MSEPEDADLRELERRLDVAFTTTQPRRGFEDELWARLTLRRRPWRARWWDQHRVAATLTASVGVAALLVGGLVTLVAHVPLQGGGASSSAGRPQVGAPVSTFGQLPLPPAQASGRAALPAAAGQNGVVEAPGQSPSVPGQLPVQRVAASAGIQSSEPPSGAEIALYASQTIDAAVAAWEAANGGLTFSSWRIQYVPVTQGAWTYWEPVYVVTGTHDGQAVTVQLPALAPASYR